MSAPSAAAPAKASKPRAPRKDPGHPTYAVRAAPILCRHLAHYVACLRRSTAAVLTISRAVRDPSDLHTIDLQLRAHSNRMRVSYPTTCPWPPLPAI